MPKIDLSISEKQRQQGLLGAAGLGALLLLVSLFLTWYSFDFEGLFDAAAQAQGVDDFSELESEAPVDIGNIPDSIGFSGWTSLEFVDAFLLFAAIAAVLIALARRREAAAGDAAASPTAPSGLFAVGLFAAVLMLVILFTKTSAFGPGQAVVDTFNDELDLPIDFSDFFSIKTGIGVYMALVGSLLVFVAGLLDSVVNATGPRAPKPAPAAPAAGTPPAPAAPASPAAGGETQAAPATGGGETQVAPTPGGGETAAGTPIPEQAAPAGWHPDPHGQASERYWDGSQWTDQTR